MKLDVMRPEAIVDINPLASTAFGQIDVSPERSAARCAGSHG